MSRSVRLSNSMASQSQGRAWRPSWCKGGGPRAKGWPWDRGPDWVGAERSVPGALVRALVACVVLALPFGVAFEPMTDKQRTAAVSQLDRADGLRETWQDLAGSQRTSAEGNAAMGNAVQQYEQVIAAFPDTEIAAMAMYNILTVCMDVADEEAAKRVYGRIVGAFPSTRYETDAHIAMGLMYLQRSHDPQQAMACFGQVRDPRSQHSDLLEPGGTLHRKATEELTQAETSYVNARLHVARCLLEERSLYRAEEQIRDLRTRYPEAREWIDSSAKALRTDVLSLPTDGNYVPPELSNALLVGGESASGVVADPGTAASEPPATGVPPSAPTGSSADGQAVNRVEAGGEPRAGADAEGDNTGAEARHTKILVALLSTACCLLTAGVAVVWWRARGRR